MRRAGEGAERSIALLGDRFIETGWLVALALVPLYVNFYSPRPYTVGKEYLLRFVVILMAAAWCLKVSAGWKHAHLREILGLARHPLTLPMVAYAAAIGVATGTSIAPALSLRGSFAWLQGASTALTYLAFFGLLVLNLRTREQVRRARVLVVLASLPVALYAIAQQLGWDPLVHTGPPDIVKWRARSTLGNHIFLGGYLVMVMPLTAAGLLEALAPGREPARDVRSDARHAGPLAVSLLGQSLLLGVFLVVSGAIPQLWWALLPVLVSYLSLALWSCHRLAQVTPVAARSLYAGLLLLQGIALVLSQARGAWLGAMAAAVVFGGLLALRRGRYRLLAGVVGGMVVAGLLVTLLNVPQGPLQPLKRFPSFDRLGSLSAFETEAIKDRLLLWKTAARLVWARPDVGLSPDPLAPARALVGYGPETFRLAAETVLPAPLARGDGWQRVHTHVHNDLLQHLAETGVLGLAAFLWLLAAFYRMTLAALWQSHDRADQLALIALVAAMTAHLAELQFGLAVTTTRALFWAYLAWAVALARPAAHAPADVAAPASRPWMVRQMALALGLAVAAITMPTLRHAGGVWLGMGGLAASMLMVAVGLGPPVRLTPRLTWRQAAIGAVVGVLAFYGSIRPLAAHAYYRFAEFEAGRGDPAGSVSAYRAALALYPREDAYHVALGQAYAQLGNLVLGYTPGSAPGPLGDGALAMAEASLQEARRLQPLDGRHVFHLAQLNHAWGLRGRPERLERAIDFYREAAAMSPQRLAVRVGWSLAHLAKREPARALEQIRTAQALGHESWAIHYALAVAYGQLGSRELALEQAKLAAQGRGDGGVMQLIPGLDDRTDPPASR